MKQSRTSLLIGACFIVIGTILLLRSLHILVYDGPMIWGIALTVGGLLFVTSGLWNRRNGRVFIGAWGFLYGLFLLMRALSMLAAFPHIKIFALTMSLSLSLLLLFLLEPANVGNLVSALCVGALSLWIYFSATNERWADDFGEFVRIYWPVALILFGISALMGRGRNRSRGGARQ